MPTSVSWREWVMGILVLALSALLGIGLDENRRQIRGLHDTTRRLEDTIQINSNRLTRLEQVYDYQQRQLNKIEAGIERLIQQHSK